MPEVARERGLIRNERLGLGRVERTGMYRIWDIVEDVSKRHSSEGESRERVDGKEKWLNKWECLLSMTGTSATMYRLFNICKYPNGQGKASTRGELSPQIPQQSRTQA